MSQALEKCLSALPALSRLVLAYVLLGVTGLLLAMPSGGGSPVFPASGLALAAMLACGQRALVGIVLGSVLLHFTTRSWENGMPISGTMTAVPGMVLGAVMQAWTGCWLVRRHLGTAWRELDNGPDTLSFLLLGGVLASLPSASIGVASLYFTSNISHGQVLFTWRNWYVGEVLGVFVFAPLSLCVLNRPSQLWFKRRRRVFLPILSTLSMVLLAFLGTARWEKKNLDNHLQADGETVVQLIADRLVAHREVVSSLRHFSEAMPDFSFRQFEQFTRITLQDNPDIFALSFNDWVSNAERPVYEEAMSQSSPLGITERDHERHVVRAATRPEYVVVRYIVPWASNQSAIGYDIYSEPIRRDAINRAVASGGMAVTSPIQLVQEQRPRIGVLELTPVKAASTTDASQAPSLLGFAVSVVKIDEMVEIATRGRMPRGLMLLLTDPQALNGRSLLYRSAALDTEPTSTDYHWQTGLRVGDRNWSLAVYPTERYLRQNQHWMAWAVGVAGLMFTALLQVLLLAMTGRAALVQRNNEALRQANLAVEAATRAKSQFLANMSHEIRTPLTAIIGFSESLLQEGQDAGQRAKAIHTIIRNGRHLQGLIANILDFSKIEAGRIEIESKQLSLPEFLADIDTLGLALAKDKNLQFSSQFLPPLPVTIRSDPTRAKQILVNLLGNAVKFTRSPGMVRLTVQLDAEHEQLILNVKDEGIGIAEADLPNLFKPFVQADVSITRKFGGTGLGLSISRALARQLGGDIQVFSSAHQGSEFVVSLSTGSLEGVRLITNLQELSVGSEPAPLATKIAQLSGQILLADDNPDNQALISLLIRRTGAQVFVVSNGQEAVEQAQLADYDLVLMDMQMPVLGGLEATEFLRLTGFDRPVVALTANATEADQTEALQAGCDGYLTKPIVQAEFFATLERYLPKRGEPFAEAKPDVSVAVKWDEDPEYLVMRDSFLHELPVMVQAIRTACEQRDWTELRTKVHELKGVAGNFGLPEASRIAGLIENQIAAENCHEAEKLVTELVVLLSNQP